MIQTYNDRQLFVATAIAILTALLIAVFPTHGYSSSTQANTTSITIPRMIDLGRNQCMPCKMMAPVLAELKRKYAGLIDIEYINVAENPDVMKQLGLPIRAVPFQIFYDSSGKEVRRHYGYMSREEILKAFKDLGFVTKASGLAGKENNK